MQNRIDLIKKHMKPGETVVTILSENFEGSELYVVTRGPSKEFTAYILPECSDEPSISFFGSASDAIIYALSTATATYLRDEEETVMNFEIGQALVSFAKDSVIHNIPFYSTTNPDFLKRVIA